MRAFPEALTKTLTICDSVAFRGAAHWRMLWNSSKWISHPGKERMYYKFSWWGWCLLFFFVICFRSLWKRQLTYFRFHVKFLALYLCLPSIFFFTLGGAISGLVFRGWWHTFCFNTSLSSLPENTHNISNRNIDLHISEHPRSFRYSKVSFGAGEVAWFKCLQAGNVQCQAQTHRIGGAELW